jgi:hypothetical protein
MLVNSAIFDRLRDDHRLHRCLPVYLTLLVEVGDQVQVQMVAVSLPVLASATGRSLRTVQRALRHLETAKLIRRLDHRRGKRVFEVLPIDGEPACLSDRAAADAGLACRAN